LSHLEAKDPEALASRFLKKTAERGSGSLELMQED